jgi:hypothetical protein
MGNNEKGDEVSGGKLGIQRVRGLVVCEDPDMVADFVKGLLGIWCRGPGLPGVSILAEAAVGVCEAFKVVLAEVVDRHSNGRSGERRL